MVKRSKRKTILVVDVLLHSLSRAAKPVGLRLCLKFLLASAIPCNLWRCQEVSRYRNMILIFLVIFYNPPFPFHHLLIVPLLNVTTHWNPNFRFQLAVHTISHLSKGVVMCLQLWAISFLCQILSHYVSYSYSRRLAYGKKRL